MCTMRNRRDLKTSLVRWMKIVALRYDERALQENAVASFLRHEFISSRLRAGEKLE